MADSEQKNEHSFGSEGASETGSPSAQAEAAVDATDTDAQAVSAESTAPAPVDSAQEGHDRPVEAVEPVEEPQSFPVTVIIRRFDPEVDDEPRWVDYDVQMFATERILDALHRIKWEIDPSLTFRRSCAHGICGSDAMRINGKNRLACKALVKDFDVSKPIYVEAIKGLRSRRTSS